MDNNKLARINYRIQDIMARKDMMGNIPLVVIGER